MAVFFAERFANDIYKRLKPYLTTAKANAAKTGVVTQEMLQTVKESTVDGSGIFEFTIPTTKAGDMQEKVSKIYLRQLKSIVQVHPDIPNTDTEIPIKSTSGE